jgi:fatty acid desaturase
VATGRRHLTTLLGHDQLRPLLIRSNRPAMARLGAHGALLVGGAVAVAAAGGTGWRWPAWILDGVVIAHLFALQHETAHGTAFVGRRVNRAVTTVCGTLLGIAPGFFRLEHMAHHAWTQDEVRDPEMIEVPASIVSWLWFLAGGPFWWYQVRTLGAHALGRWRAGELAFVPARARRHLRREAALLLASWTVLIAVPLMLGSDAVLVFWVVPRILGEPVMRLARLSEHAGRSRTGDLTENTRTLDVPAPLRLLAWNMPFHAEHHAVPAVPFHALPQLRVLLADHLDGPTGGYLEAQVDIVGQIRAARHRTRDRWRRR